MPYLKKLIVLIFATVILSQANAQVCNIIDSIETSPPQINNRYIHPVGISYNNGGLWVAGSTLDASMIYKYDLSGKRIDSIPYEYTDNPYEAIEVVGKSMWAIRYGIDTLYEIDMISKIVKQKFKMGNDSAEHEFIDLAHNGDTLYIFDNMSQSRSKFIIPWAQIVKITDGNSPQPTGVHFMHGKLFGTTYDPNKYRTFQIDINNLGLIENSVANWCLNKNLALTSDGEYFYQTNWDNTKIYKIQSSYLVGINNVNEPEFNTGIFPNPSTGNFTIKTELQNAEIEISNALGEVVYKKKAENAFAENEYQIQLHNAKGIYFVKIFNQNLSCVKKLILQ